MIGATSGAFAWTPTEAQGPGIYNITVRVTELNQPCLSSTRTLQVTVNEVNQPPVLAAIGNKTVNENSPLVFGVVASDPDLPANTLTYSATGLPAGATLNSSTGVFNWTPSYYAAGVYHLVYSVSDGTLSDSEAADITVNDVNGPPRFSAVGSQVVNEHQPLNLTLAATDPDTADTLTYAMTDLNPPAGASLDPATGQFSWTPSESQGPGGYDLHFTVNDGHAHTDSLGFHVTVNEVNDPPVMSLSDQNVVEATPLAFVISAIDPDTGQQTTYSLDSAPAARTSTQPAACSRSMPRMGRPLTA